MGVGERNKNGQNIAGQGDAQAVVGGPESRSAVAARSSAVSEENENTH